jgi:hypothetical protein
VTRGLGSGDGELDGDGAGETLPPVGLVTMLRPTFALGGKSRTGWSFRVGSMYALKMAAGTVPP